MDTSITRFRPGIPGLVPDAWLVEPETAQIAPPVVVVHGITRRVPEMITALAPRARATGRTLVLPHFDKTQWRRYQRAACKNRADRALLRLMAALQEAGEITGGRFDLSGFSGGAQFAHRFAWLYPERVGALCATAPGWWTFPDTKASWPLGAGLESGKTDLETRLEANLRRFLDRRIVVCVGSDDMLRDRNLRKGAAIDNQQGLTRVIRARRWADAATARARQFGLEPRISFRVLQGCGHDFTECVTNGALDRDFISQTTPCAACLNQHACAPHRLTADIERIAA